jgi:hypothetical protein
MGWRSDFTANNWGGNLSGSIGWREKLFVCDNPWSNYNFIGAELTSQFRMHESHFGARMMLQPWSFFQTSLAYERTSYPLGLMPLSPDKPQNEDHIWSQWDWGNPLWGDQFTWMMSLQKEFGSVQGKAKFEWSRIDIDSDSEFLYLPADDIPVRSRDDILRAETMIGYRIDQPFLSAWGLAHTAHISSPEAFWLGWKPAEGHEIIRRRAGIWAQAWPFSARSEGALRYWSLRTRLDIWFRHPTRQYEPRVEVSVGWERNMLAPVH